MAIEGIQGINSVLDLMSSTNNIANKAIDNGFSSIFANALEDAADAESVDRQGSLALLSGEVNDIHTVTLEVQQAELTLRLAVEIRNKLVDAYNELLRMSV